MMITENDIQKPRSPRGLRQFVMRRKKIIQSIRPERHNAIQRRGLYNVFIKEIVPLSVFALKAYENSCAVQPVLGNQGYDAIIKDNDGNVIDFLELTFPDDWKSEAEDADLIVSRGYRKIDVTKPGGDIDRLSAYIQDICFKKAIKDYSDCTLVIVIAFWPVSKQFHALYSRKIQEVITNVQAVSFKAKRVFLLLLEQHKIIEINNDKKRQRTTMQSSRQ